ncbi:MAG: glycoside hydrolase family 2 TIM barrel-domain containing protein [Capsulimonadales bacterium]|nr:glycoside hydrolase family 2 TIM barrel-domain containing protein [Capsulimonadales bacterium]
MPTDSRILTLRGGAVTLLFLALAVLAGAQEPSGTPVPVRVTRTPSNVWSLTRNGKPYFIRGAGGADHLELLVKSGGNSIRTWGADEAGALLDRAQKLGLTVTVGIWLGHKQHGFRYDDPKMVAEQRAKAKGYVARFKNHPALLMWAVGNEMEGDGRDPAVWKAVEEIAADIRKADPNHPTMTVIAEIGEGGIKAKEVARLCPSIDILGVNSYGGAPTLPKRLKDAGWSKPYVVTEFGPNGPWEVGKTAWGAAFEPNSTEKAADYRMKYERSVAASSGWCLGSYVFLWSDKVEATPTWFGMFLPGTKERLGPVEEMANLWSGKYPEQRVPVLKAVTTSVANKEVAPDSSQTAQATVIGAGSLRYRWEIRPDDTSPSRPDPGQVAPAALTALTPSESGNPQVTFVAPDKPGAYRLYLYVRDGQGGAATANFPFFVRASATASDAGTAAKLPFVLYGDAGGSEPYAPSGYMGNAGAIKMDPACTEQPYRGKTCLRIAYTAPGEWGGVVWQNPANDWGEMPGGYDLRGATKLSFLARGAKGGEKVEFQAGLPDRKTKYYDTGNGKRGITLTSRWSRYEIDLRGQDLSRMKNGFVWVVAGTGKPVVFYLDDIRYE